MQTYSQMLPQYTHFPPWLWRWMWQITYFLCLSVDADDRRELAETRMTVCGCERWLEWRRQREGSINSFPLHGGKRGGMWSRFRWSSSQTFHFKTVKIHRKAFQSSRGNSSVQLCSGILRCVSSCFQGRTPQRVKGHSKRTFWISVTIIRPSQQRPTLQL